MAVVTDKQFFVIVAIALVVGGIVIYKTSKMVEQVEEKVEQAGEAVTGVVTTDLNPAHRDNIVNRNFTKIWRGILDDPNWTLGGWIYKVTHPAPSN